MIATSSNTHPATLRTHYENEGILYLNDFLSPQQLQLTLQDIQKAERLALDDLARNWDNQKVTFFSKNPVKKVTEENSEDFVVTPYFQHSALASHIFFEEINNTLVLNRLGHALHLEKELPTLREIVFTNERLNRLLFSFGYISPTCLLSVYIPKLPHGFGSEVRPHQESTFAHTQPLSSCVLWIALEDATVENACMYGLPRSHKLPLKFISKVDHDMKRRDFVQINEAEIPDFNERDGTYVPLEVKAGDALIFHGNFVHCSPKNVSGRSRKALSFQFVETADTSFSSFNWIRQPNMQRLYG